VKRKRRFERNKDLPVLYIELLHMAILALVDLRIMVQGIKEMSAGEKNRHMVS
jgi:hypothetical protein